MDSVFDDETDENSLESKFNRAAEYLQSLIGKLDQNKLLEFYGLYKQATVGKCNIEKPGIFNVQARAKWTVWNNLGSMTREAAMLAYVDNLTEIESDWDDDFEKSKKSNGKKPGWVNVSAPLFEDDDLHTNEKTLVDHVKEGNIDELLAFFSSCATISNIDDDDIFTEKKQLVNEHDQHGLAAVHWAADRGHADILDLLLTNGAEANLTDLESNQTALHYAISCGHIEAVKTLLKHGADPLIKDADNLTCIDMALDVDETEILHILNEHTR